MPFLFLTLLAYERIFGGVRSGEGREEKRGEEGEGSMHEYSKRVRPGHKAKIQDT